MKRTTYTAFVLLLASGSLSSLPQSTSQFVSPHSDSLTETGQIVSSGRSVGYVIRHLPVSSFPELPSPIAAAITASGCLIPQTYEAHQPENVVHAALEHAGSDDWALLCSTQGTVQLMVFFSSAPEHPMTLARASETEHLQHHGVSPTLGFNWGIDPASPRRVHEAQIGLPRRPAAPDHDALADSIVDHKTIYHYYTKGRWTLVDLPD